MSRKGLRLALALVCTAGLASAAAAQQTTTTTEQRQFEIVAVDGNKVVVKGPQGTREVTVNDDFRLTVDGRAIPVSELRPGMKGTATITTTTTSMPVTVTEVKNGEVVQSTGNSIIVKGPDGFKMFSEGDVAKRNVRIYKDGKPVQFADLHTGDRLSATIVTQQPPKVMTQRQVNAALSGVPGAAAGTTGGGSAPSSSAAPSASSGASTPSATGTTASKTRKTLPRTASILPLAALLAAASLAAGVVLNLRRRRSAR